MGNIPQASATAPPPVLPPHVFVMSYGLSVAPNTVLNVCEPAPNSGVFVLPIVMAPARLVRLDGRFNSIADEIPEDRRSERGPNAFRELHVLVRDRQSMQRPNRLTGRQRAWFAASAYGYRLIRRERDDGVDLRVDASDLLEVRCQRFAR